MSYLPSSQYFELTGRQKKPSSSFPQIMTFLLTRAFALGVCITSVLASPTCDQLSSSGITTEPYLSVEYDYDQTQYW